MKLLLWERLPAAIKESLLSAVVIPAGVVHNIINTSSSNDMRLYTIYTPPEHPDGTVHQTKADAEAAGH